MANPMPSLPPLREGMAVLMPTTSPCKFTSGPPLLPGLMAASVCRKFSRSVIPIPRCFALMMPAVTVLSRPNGCPKRENPVADLDLIAVAKRCGHEIRCRFDLDDGQVGLGIRPDIGRHKLTAIVRPHDHIATAGDHVVVGQDDSRAIDDHARANSSTR